MNAPWTDKPVFCLTCDVDWASETAIQSCQDLFADHGVKATWFGTHKSSLFDQLRSEDRLEAGVHPNFLPGSSQGESFTAVMDSLETAVPGAVCFRSHRYFDVTDINLLCRDRGFLYDSNVFTFLHKLPPYRHFSGLVRFPCFWEDGTWLESGRGLDLGAFEAELFAPGLTILSVHPMHMAMNSPSLAWAREVKDRLSREEWNAMDAEAIAKATHTGRGIRDFVGDMLEMILTRGHSVHSLGELHAMYLDTNDDQGK